MAATARPAALAARAWTAGGACGRWFSASARARLSSPGAASPAIPSPGASSPGAPPFVEVDGRRYATDGWFNVPAHVLAATTRRLHLQADHPVAITRQILEGQFPGPTFRHYAAALHPAVTPFENFDSLGFPADHPGRQRSDTYYVNAQTLLRTHTSAHELATFRANASRGFLLSADVYRRDEVDRTHYPVFHQMEGVRVWDRRADADAAGDLAAAVRRDLAALPTHDVPVEDPTGQGHHDPVSNPRQEAHHSAAEVAAVAAHLKRSLELMVVAVFRRAQQAAQLAAAAATDAQAAAAAAEPLRMRWVEAYFPFTSPSWELEVYYAGDWLEVLGCGISQQAILAAAGVPSQMAWAFGIGLDRIAMLLFQIPDIRLFWSADERFLGQFRGVSADLDRLRRFVPFSKHPPCYKDVSFWVPEADAGTGAGAAPLHNNDVMEVIRSVAGDVVEDARLVDAFAHPRSGRQSRCYRINYRSLERTLTNAETNRLHDDVTAALVQRLGVEVR